MSKSEYVHKEAFCIMTYKCRKCHKTEEVYNTRDGATPFTLGCRYCDGGMVHINWNHDIQDPHFRPLRGMRVLLDFTKERAFEAAQKTLEYARQRKDFDVPEMSSPEYIKAISDLAGKNMDGGVVDIRTV